MTKRLVLFFLIIGSFRVALRFFNFNNYHFWDGKLGRLHFLAPGLLNLLDFLFNFFSLLLCYCLLRYNISGNLRVVSRLHLSLTFSQLNGGRIVSKGQVSQGIGALLSSFSGCQEKVAFLLIGHWLHIKCFKGRSLLLLYMLLLLDRQDVVVVLWHDFFEFEGHRPFFQFLIL